MKVDLVVARYSEDVRWLESIDINTIIYNKGDSESIYSNIKNKSNIKIINLPNIGRETHTLTKHIVLNYNNIADITIFLQGNPLDHLHNFNFLYHGKSITDFLLFVQKNPFSVRDLFFGFGLYHSDAAFELQVNSIFNYLKIKNLKYTTKTIKKQFIPFFDRNGQNRLQNVYSIGCQYFLPKEYIISKPLTLYKEILSWHELEDHPFIEKNIKNSPYYRWSKENELAPIPLGDKSCLSFALERAFLNIFANKAFSV